MAICAAAVILFSSSSYAAEMTRAEDFVVLAGKDVSPMIGARTRDLRLYSCGSGTCKAVPLQVDKVDPAGRYVFPQDADSDRDGKKLDENDELCFMAGDAGDQRPGGWRPSSARGVELELHDPLDRAKAWVYLFDEPGSEPPDLPDYVTSRPIRTGPIKTTTRSGRASF